MLAHPPGQATGRASEVYTGERGAEQQRQAFAMVAWAARVGADPAEDFDALVAELWKSVDGLFRITERVGAGEQTEWGMFPPELVHPDDPPITEWGKR